MITDTVNTALSDLAWLAGFWDADGHISVCKRTTYLVPVVACTNTNKQLIDNVMRILDAADITYRLDYQDRGKRTNAKPAWTIKMEGRVRVLPFLQLVTSYLVGKQEQANKVIEWCNLPRGTGKKAVSPRYWEIKQELAVLNARGRVRD